MAEGSTETDRVGVKTYVPRYQKVEWEEQANDLEMSQSEFVRTMVQAGRRDFDLDPVEARSEGATPGGDGLEDRVIDVLGSEGPLAWDELVASLTDDFEEELEGTLQDLQAENRVQHTGRQGYTLTDE